MSYSKRISSTKGFTLVELLIVMVVMGLVITSVYSLFLNSKKTANTSEEVVDVQQNVRIAMETLVADIRMAGFLVDGTAIIDAAATFGINNNDDGDFDDVGESGEFFSIQTCSSRRTYSRILNEDSGGNGLVVEANMSQYFIEEDLVSIIRPGTNGIVFNLLEVDTVTVTDSDNNRIPLALSPTNPDATGYTVASVGVIQAGDMIVRKIVNEAFPSIIRYWLRKKDNGGDNNFELMRGVVDSVDSTIFTETSLIASNINAMSLNYILEDGTETTTPANLNQIRAIRINITGETDEDRTAKYSGIKRRSLQTVVKIQNAFGG